MKTQHIIFIITCIIWNLLVFFMYGADKRKAKHGKWRVSENALLISAILMGGIGAFLGMHVFRHKTKHLKFTIGIPMAILFNIAIVVAAGYLIV